MHPEALAAAFGDAAIPFRINKLCSSRLLDNRLPQSIEANFKSTQNNESKSHRGAVYIQWKSNNQTPTAPQRNSKYDQCKCQHMKKTSTFILFSLLFEIICLFMTIQKTHFCFEKPLFSSFIFTLKATRLAMLILYWNYSDI